MRTTAAALLIALVAIPTAAAHGRESGEGYVSSVERIVDANGVEAEASGDGHFTFTAPAGRVVVVHGYHGEPYLRFVDGQVEENELSPTAYENEEQDVPESANPKAQPRWTHKASGRTYTWEDRRTHWAEEEPPAAVRAHPDEEHHISNWKVTGTVDETPFSIEGSLSWRPRKDSSPSLVWISYLAIAFGVLYGAFLIVSRRRTTASG